MVDARHPHFAELVKAEETGAAFPVSRAESLLDASASTRTVSASRTLVLNPVLGEFSVVIHTGADIRCLYRLWAK